MFQIYLTQRQQDCFYFEKEDRIGIYTTEIPGSVAFTFNTSNAQAQQYVDDPNNPATIGAEVEFDPLAYPYLFSAAAYIDTGKTF